MFPFTLVKLTLINTKSRVLIPNIYNLTMASIERNSNLAIIESRQCSQVTPFINILGSPVTALSFEEQISLMLYWAQLKLSKSVCVANVHMLMEAYRNPKFHEILMASDLITPDGMPLVRMMQLLGARTQERVAGFDIFNSLCAKAPEYGVSIFLLGADEETLELMHRRLQEEYPQLTLAGRRPLPFGKNIAAEVNQSVIDEINHSGAGLVFVALGCPKQETWIANHKGHINATMLGLGYVFESYAGLQKRAPKWVRQASLEWGFRLMQEPKRLWKRYFLTIPPFLFLAGCQLFMSLMGQFHTKAKLDSKMNQ